MLTRITHIWLCMQTWPEDQFPMQPVGKMVLDQCAGNIFNEVEQIAFSPSMLVPGELPPDDLQPGITAIMSLLALELQQSLHSACALHPACA